MTKLALLKRTSKNFIVALQQIINPIALVKYHDLGSFPSENIQTLPNETFANVIMQPNDMQGEHWIMKANCCHELFFADILGLERYSFLKEHCKQMIPEPLQTHPTFCGFYMIYAAFHLFKLRHKENTGTLDADILSFVSNYMCYLNFFWVNVQCTLCFCYLYSLITIFEISNQSIVIALSHNSICGRNI